MIFTSPKLLTYLLTYFSPKLIILINLYWVLLGYYPLRFFDFLEG